MSEMGHCLQTPYPIWWNLQMLYSWSPFYCSGLQWDGNNLLRNPTLFMYNRFFWVAFWRSQFVLESTVCASRIFSMFSLFDKTKSAGGRVGPGETEYWAYFRGRNCLPHPAPLNTHTKFGKQNKAQVSTIQVYILLCARGKLLAGLFPWVCG